MLLEIILYTLINATVLYIISYLNEKGKNLATQEDIEKITEKVEEVKSEFSDKSQILMKKDMLMKN